MTELERLPADLSAEERSLFNDLCRDVFHAEPTLRRAQLAAAAAKRMVRAMHEGAGWVACMPLD